jgi:Spy/CpxP family protein refolding chaperone
MRTTTLCGILAILLGAILIPGASAAAAEGDPAPATPAPAVAAPQPGQGQPAPFTVRQFGADQMQQFQSNQSLRLLEDKSIREQIGLTPAQEERLKDVQAKIKTLRDGLQEKLKAAQGPQDPDQPLTVEQERERRRISGEAQQALQADLAPLIKEAMEILTPEQRAKLQEIAQKLMRAQTLGAVSQFISGKAKEELGLSDTQVESINKIVAEAVDKAQAMMKETMESMKNVSDEDRPAAMQKLFQEMRDKRETFMKDVREKVMGTLEPEQKEKADKLFNEQQQRWQRRPQAQPESKAPAAETAPAPAPAAQ